MKQFIIGILLCLPVIALSEDYQAGQLIDHSSVNSKFQSIKGRINARGFSYDFSSLEENKKIESSILNESFNNFKPLAPDVSLIEFSPAMPIKASEMNQNFNNVNFKIDTQLSVRSCTVSSGSGSETFSDSLNAWQTCTPSSCISNFHIESNLCLSNTRTCSISNGSGSQNWVSGTTYSTCIATSCTGPFHIESNLCLSDTRVCSVTNGSGSQSWNSGSSSYNTCIASSCTGPNHVESGLCLSDTRSCAITNGIGSQTWNTGSSSYDTCSIVDCNENFHSESGSCLANTRSCTIASGTGTGSQTWNIGSSSYNTCFVVSCSGATPIPSIDNQSCVAIEASGGSISFDGDYKIHTFNANSSLNVVTVAPGATYEYLMIGGGGGGGGLGAGGGAGGYVTRSGVSISTGTYPVAIGNGGLGATGAITNSGANGQATTFNSLIAAGGGGGGGHVVAGLAGASGGGGGYQRAGGANYTDGSFIGYTLDHQFNSGNINGWSNVGTGGTVAWSSLYGGGSLRSTYASAPQNPIAITQISTIPGKTYKIDYNIEKVVGSTIASYYVRAYDGSSTAGTMLGTVGNNLAQPFSLTFTAQSSVTSIAGLHGADFGTWEITYITVSSPPQGFPGGSGAASQTLSSGGGGGAGQAGQNAVGNSYGGKGGDGLSSSITGSPIFRAGGGGGTSETVVSGNGGAGGGGRGGGNPGQNAGHGTPNTGSGGGGGYLAPWLTGNGGSGVLIIRYRYK